MPDTTAYLHHNSGPQSGFLAEKYTDNLDGTFSQQVVIASGSATVIRTGQKFSAISQASVTTTVMKIVPTNATRVSILITNFDANTTVWLGTDNTVTATTGQRIKAGESYSKNYVGELWMIADSGAVRVGMDEEYN